MWLKILYKKKNNTNNKIKESRPLGAEILPKNRISGYSANINRTVEGSGEVIIRQKKEYDPCIQKRAMAESVMMISD
jgi:hypothetical protein